MILLHHFPSTLSSKELLPLHWFILNCYTLCLGIDVVFMLRIDGYEYIISLMKLCQTPDRYALLFDDNLWTTCDL